jgi:asparagine synthase (glutamine-hydrolysing)
MAGIAGISATGCGEKVKEMLGLIRYRGRTSISVFEKEGTTLGMIWNDHEEKKSKELLASGMVGEDHGPGHFVKVRPENGKFKMERDELGFAPLYYGSDRNGNTCFSSEVKALVNDVASIRELLPGTSGEVASLSSWYELKKGRESDENPVILAETLFKLLSKAVMEYTDTKDIGSWLSGGLDSSSICALASKYTSKLKTFSAGIKGSPDLDFSREMASHIKSEHHEVVVTLQDLLDSLPDVIYHLESFDALLVRSSITNYLVAKLASDHISDVFSGEGGDELFAGYEYLKSIPAGKLQDELISITNALHNTALQRVDRSSSAHGTTAHAVFTRPDIVEFAFTVPAKFKIHDNTEKWILRKAMERLLPETIFKRPKAKFWEGAGIRDLISDYAAKHITGNDFRSERILANGFIINTIEELFYYRIFREHFGKDIDISWMGRTKGSPLS